MKLASVLITEVLKSTENKFRRLPVEISYQLSTMGTETKLEIKRLTTLTSGLSMSKKIYVIAPVAGIAVAAGIATLWFSGTPRYAAFQMGRAIETGNAQEALHYVDSDALATGTVEMAISVVKQEALTQIQGNQNNWETLGTGSRGLSYRQPKRAIKEPTRNSVNY
jgi:hypothetical protein